MYCEKCGKELPAGSVYCEHCGTESKRRPGVHINTRSLAAFLCVVVAIVAILLSVNLFSVNSSPENVAKALLKADAAKDADAYVKCRADYWIRDTAWELDLEEDVSRKDFVKGLEKHWRFSEPVKITIRSCEVEETHDMSNYSFLWKEEGMTREDYNTITELAKVRVTYHTEDYGAEEMVVVCIKMDGKWYVMS